MADNYTPPSCKAFSLSELNDVMLEILESGGKITFAPRGASMQPMLYQGRDRVTIEKPPERLKVYDIPFYRRDDGRFVMHRIVGIKDGAYKLCGDNQYSVEYPVRRDQIFAVVTSFERCGRQISCKAFSYRVYCFLWTLFLPVRKQLLAVKRFLGRIKRRVKR